MFLGILKVLLSIGPIFVLSRHKHREYYLHGGALLIIVFHPLYLCILRPFISYHIPGMLKRIIIVFFLLCISLVSLLVMYTVMHGNIFVYDKLKVCVNTQTVDLNTSDVLNPSYPKVIHLTSQHTLSALFQMLVYISIWSSYAVRVLTQ